MIIHVLCGSTCIHATSNISGGRVLNPRVFFFTWVLIYIIYHTYLMYHVSKQNLLSYGLILKYTFIGTHRCVITHTYILCTTVVITSRYLQNLFCFQYHQYMFTSFSFYFSDTVCQRCPLSFVFLPLVFLLLQFGVLNIVFVNVP